MAIDHIDENKIDRNELAHEDSTSHNESNERISHSLTFRAMILFQVLAYGSYSILVHLCEHDGHIMFSSATMNLVLELVKLIFSLIALLCTSKQSSSILFAKGSFVQHSLPYAVPGLLYFINNNLAVHMQLQMDPASYQILSNFKIATTAILYRIIIKHKLSQQQWFAVALLFSGGLFYSLGNVTNSAVLSMDNTTKMFIRPLGLPMILLYCTLSGLAGVYNEWILKKYYTQSLHLQNIYLYTYGSLLNLVPAVGIPLLVSGSFHQLNPFEGFSIYTWLVIVTQALNGLFMAKSVMEKRDATHDHP
ncbi:unnamed protein product [Rotaria magnacalcarata]|uniref:UDP-sugar transporter protein SLC35A4 n=1 Tax=Rotaria magnacalcarata TaxID=392030 RepID=A0A816AQY8_9BILA|nr:unnamed protein product [Rotaria magnacalcarata]CAF2144992.1 unnamed protein product [Rotaria magnacalcarata]CAF3799810.1 unnamed protein product [Rotaria magnacalcarata]